jgi:hypothetical protein
MKMSLFLIIGEGERLLALKGDEQNNISQFGLLHVEISGQM